MTNTEPTSTDYDAIGAALIESREYGTPDELAIAMVRTVRRACMTSVLTQDRARFILDREIDEIGDAIADSSRADLDDESESDRAEIVQSLVHQAEQVAMDMGYVVIWDGGYSIYDLVPLTPRQRQIVIEGEQLDHCGNSLDDFSDDALSLNVVAHDGVRLEQPEHTMAWIERVADLEEVEEREYTVTWTIQLDASSPVEAARRALAMQRKSDSTATVFVVDGVEIDLEEEA